jgi:hypothetical protein
MRLSFLYIGHFVTLKSGWLDTTTLVVCLTASAFAVATWSALGLWDTRATLAGVTDQRTWAESAPQTAAVVAAEPAADFTSTLPTVVAAAQVLDVLQSTATETGVALESVQVQELLGSEARLGRVELLLFARGGYLNIKRWLGKVMAQTPHTTLVRLQLQRAEALGTVEVRLTLVAWARPVAAVSSPGTR